MTDNSAKKKTARKKSPGGQPPAGPPDAAPGSPAKPGDNSKASPVEPGDNSQADGGGSQSAAGQGKPADAKPGAKPADASPAEAPASGTKAAGPAKPVAVDEESRKVRVVAVPASRLRRVTVDGPPSGHVGTPEIAAPADPAKSADKPAEPSAAAPVTPESAQGVDAAGAPGTPVVVVAAEKVEPAAADPSRPADAAATEAKPSDAPAGEAVPVEGKPVDDDIPMAQLVRAAALPEGMLPDGMAAAALLPGGAGVALAGAMAGQVSDAPLPDVVAMLPVRNTVVFPHAVMPMAVGRDKSKRLLQETLPNQKVIGIVCQKNGDLEDPGPGDVHMVGTLASVLKLFRLDDGGLTVVISGLTRIRITEVLQTEPFLRARVQRIPDVPAPPGQETDALLLHVRSKAKEYIRRSDHIPDEAALMLENIEGPAGVSDFLAANLDISLEEKQELLETASVERRLARLSDIVVRRLEMLQLSQKIHETVRAGIDKTQREYYLREQLKAIQEELGQADERTEEIAELRKALREAKMPEAVLKEAERELARMERIPQASPEHSVTRTYLELLSELPWAVSSKDRTDLRRADRILNEDHYDLEKVKKRIIEHLAVRKLKKDGKGPILCFVGPPGVGKTSLGKSIARSLGRKFIRIALGGMHDESEIRGHRRTYIGAMPGRLIQEIRKAGTNNPVIMLDEIDKVGKDWRGDPASALLEALDPAQNDTFTDHYLDVPFDLSKVLFIATANVMDPVPQPLADRMETIEISGYTEEQKLHIARQYLLPRQTKENGLSAEILKVSDEAITEIIRHYTREAGVRNLERSVAAVCRGVAAKVAKGEAKNADVGPADIKGFLGPAQFESEVRDRTGIPGVATGLAWTSFGGDILFVESTAWPGKGAVQLTGQLGDVMKESAQAAMSYIRSHAKELGVAAETLTKRDIHIHVPAGATPKDGPSAGVSMLTSIVSLLTRRPARSDLAMTGEITLRGLVLPIGGVKEKTLAAHRAGIHEVIIPERNRKDLEEIPESVRKSMTFHFVEKVDQVLALAIPKSDPKPPAEGPAKPAPDKPVDEAIPAKPARKSSDKNGKSGNGKPGPETGRPGPGRTTIKHVPARA